MDRFNGYVLVDKPKGWTSFDAVAKVRSLATQALRRSDVPLAPGQSLPKRVKVGHTGTLDPLATGLLVILIGNYTKRATELAKADKTYKVTMKLGETSTTGDDEGEKTAMSNRRPAMSELEAAMQAYTGSIMQTPPIYSAMKVSGVRAYKLAREGKEVVLEPRPAKIYRMVLTDYSYPYVCFTAEVSSGTYIRSLVEDLGSTLSIGAYMSDLRRTRAGQFRVDDATSIEELVRDGVSTQTLPAYIVPTTP